MDCNLQTALTNYPLTILEDNYMRVNIRRVARLSGDSRVKIIAARF